MSEKKNKKDWYTRDYLVSLRRMLNLTRSEFALHLNMVRQQYEKYELGALDFSEQKIIYCANLIEQFYGVSSGAIIFAERNYMIAKYKKNQYCLNPRINYIKNYV